MGIYRTKTLLTKHKKKVHETYTYSLKPRRLRPHKLKPVRTFNGKVYVRIASYGNKSIVDQLKLKLTKTHNALIIKSGPNYQLWVRKREVNK